MTTSKIRLWTAASLTLIPTLILVLARFAWDERLPRNRREPLVRIDPGRVQHHDGRFSPSRW